MEIQIVPVLLFLFGLANIAVFFLALWDFLKSGRKTIAAGMIVVWVFFFSVVASLPLLYQPILHETMIGQVMYWIGMPFCWLIGLIWISEDKNPHGKKGDLATFFCDTAELIKTYGVPLSAVAFTPMFAGVLINFLSLVFA